MFLIDDVEDELAREIGREVHVTQAYLSTWRPSGTVAHAVNLDVAQNLTETVSLGNASRKILQLIIAMHASPKASLWKCHLVLEI